MHSREPHRPVDEVKTNKQMHRVNIAPLLSLKISFFDSEEPIISQAASFSG
jgi:hypothetical protein